MSYVVMLSPEGQIWQFDQLLDALSKLAEFTTLDQPVWAIQSQLEQVGRYSTFAGEHWVELFLRV